MWLRQPRLGSLTSSKHLWATPPHYHYGHSVIISTSELATSRSTRSLLHTHTHTHTHSAPDSRHGCHNGKPPTQMHYPPMHSNNNIPMWENPASITQTIYLPTMCHPNKPTKTHSCTGWEQTTPDAKQRHVDVIPKINDVSNHH